MDLQVATSSRELVVTKKSCRPTNTRPRVDIRFIGMPSFSSKEKSRPLHAGSLRVFRQVLAVKEELELGKESPLKEAKVSTFLRS